MNQAQNEEIKALLSRLQPERAGQAHLAWAAIPFAPTLIGTMYGMNFANMPGLEGDGPVR